jgi:hypothetical protein
VKFSILHLIMVSVVKLALGGAEFFSPVKKEIANDNE